MVSEYKSHGIVTNNALNNHFAGTRRVCLIGFVHSRDIPKARNLTQLGNRQLGAPLNHLLGCLVRPSSLRNTPLDAAP
jgi:hypothetical protein